MYHSTRADRRGSTDEVTLEDQRLAYSVSEASISPGIKDETISVSARTLFYCASGRGWISYPNSRTRYALEPGVVFVAQERGALKIESTESMFLLLVEPRA